MKVDSETLYMIYASTVGFRAVTGAALVGASEMPARTRDSWAATFEAADSLSRQLTSDSTPLEAGITGERFFTVYRERANNIAYSGGPIPDWSALTDTARSGWEAVASFWRWAWGRMEFAGEDSPKPPRIHLFDLDPATLVGIAKCDDGDEGWVVMHQPFADDDVRPVSDEIGAIVYFDSADAVEVCKTGRVWKHDMGEELDEDTEDPDSGPLAPTFDSPDPACLVVHPDEHSADPWVDIAARETWLHQDEDTGALIATPVSDQPAELLRKPIEAGELLWPRNTDWREPRWGDTETREEVSAPVRFTVVVTLSGYADLEPLAERVRSALETHPTLSMRVGDVAAYTGDMRPQQLTSPALAAMSSHERNQAALVLEHAQGLMARGFDPAIANTPVEGKTELHAAPSGMGMVGLLAAAGIDLSPTGLQRELELARARPWIEAPWQRGEMEDAADGEEAWYLPEGALAEIHYVAPPRGSDQRATWRLVLQSPLYTDPQHARNAGNRIVSRFPDACLSGGLTEVEPGVYGTVSGRLQEEQ